MFRRYIGGTRVKKMLGNHIFHFLFCCGKLRFSFILIFLYRIILAFNSGNIPTLLVYIQSLLSGQKRAGFLEPSSLLFIVISYCMLHVRTDINYINIGHVLNRLLRILF